MSNCCICLKDYDSKTSKFIDHCHQCGHIYKEKSELIKMAKSKPCKYCGDVMDYYLLAGEYDFMECGSCGHSESCY